MLLEALMLRALACIQEARSGQVALGPQPWSPLAPYVFEASLRQLLTRHGDPRCPWDRLEPASHLLADGRAREAWAVLRTRPNTPASPRARELEVACLVALGSFQEAWMALGPALESHPASFRLWMERFRIAMTRRDHGTAREALAMARRLLPPGGGTGEVPEWHLRSAEFALWAEGDPLKAWSHFEMVPEALREQNQRLLLAIQVERGEFEAALARVRALQERNPAPELRLLEARCLAGLEAWDALAHRLEHPPDPLLRDPQFWHLRGRAHWHRGDLAAARVELETSVRLDPRNLDAILDAGQVCLDLGDPAGAETHGRLALGMDPRGQDGLLHLAEARLAQHDSEGARRLLRECLLHHPDSEEAQAFLAELEAN